MKRKHVVVAGVALAAIAAGLLLFVLLGGEPQPAPPPADEPLSETPARVQPTRTTPTRTQPAYAEPDPVQVDRPAEPQPVDPEHPRLLVEGQVIDGNGIGIADVLVMFSGQHALTGITGSGYTDSVGRYRMVAWSPSSARRSLSPDRRGIVSARAPDGGLAVSESVEIPQEESVSMPVLTIAAGGEIEGRVVNELGAPAPGARVSVQSSLPLTMPDLSGRDPRMVSRPLLRMVHADERGQFRFARLPAGTYRVTGDPGYWGMNTSAAIVSLEQNSRAWAAVELRAENFVRGAVVDSLGEPVAGVPVRLYAPEDEASGDVALRRAPIRPQPGSGEVRRFDEEPAGMAQQVTDAHGRFGFFGLRDIEYVLAARLGEVEARQEGVRINQPDFRLMISMPGAATVSGVVRDAETGRAVEAFEARVFASARALEGLDPFARVAENRVFAWRPGGQFRVTDVPAGDFGIRITAHGYVPAMLAVTEMQQSEQRSGLTVELNPLCEVTITPLLDDRRLDLEPVMLLFDDRLAYQASTDSAGQVRIPAVAPGRYQLKLILRNGTILTAPLEVPAMRNARIEVELTAG
jgi:protocatechuate 3,4-dioxygenase beta subunit